MNRRNSLVWAAAGLLVLAGLALVAPAAAAPATPDYQGFFDQAMTEQLQAEQIVGATVALVQDGELVFAKGYGYADLQRQIPVQADQTLFFIGSDGKLFTWTAVLQLVEQGKLDLHTDINQYLDFELPQTFEQPITLHHLMTHTAGFEEEHNALLRDDPAQVLPLREFLLRFMPQRVYRPGEVSAYSNYGSALAGYIIERVSGEPFEQYLSQHLLLPLGMYHSFAGHTIPPQLAADLSKGYLFRNGSHAALDFEWVAAVPAAPIRATAVDLSRFMLAHLEGGCVDDTCILQPQTLAQMHQQQFTQHPRLTGMAYGFAEARMNGQRLIWHMGESARFTTVLALIPEQNLGLLVSYNTPPANGRSILFRFLNQFFPVEQTPLQVAPLPGWQERAAIINGTYVPARSAQTTPQKVLNYLEAVPVALADGAFDFGGWHFVEVEPWLFQQVDGERMISIRHDPSNGRVWLSQGLLTYFQVPWYQTLSAQLPLLAGISLLFLSAWIAWPLVTLRPRRQGPPRPSRAVLLLAAGAGLFELGLLAWYVTLLLGFGELWVFPQDSVRLLVWLYWLAIPLTLALLGIAAHAWIRRNWSLAWRLHYSLVALASLALLYFAWSWNLLGGRV